MDKCLIIRYQLGSKVWFLVEQNNKVLSTPLDSWQQAVDWIGTITGCRMGCTLLTQDVTEVTLQGGMQ